MELSRRSFFRLLFQAAAWVLAGSLAHALYARPAAAPRRRFPGRVRPLNRSAMAAPGPWAG